MLTVWSPAVSAPKIAELAFANSLKFQPKFATVGISLAKPSAGMDQAKASVIKSKALLGLA